VTAAFFVTTTATTFMSPAAAAGSVRSLRMRPAAAITMRCLSVRRTGLRCYSMSSTCVGMCRAAGMQGRAAARMRSIRCSTRSAVIAASAFPAEAMAAPPVTVSPTAPWPHAQKDAVIEIPWTVEPHRRAGVRCVAVVAVGADRLNADANDDLCLRRWCPGQCRDQCRRSE